MLAGKLGLQLQLQQQLSEQKLKGADKGGDDDEGESSDDDDDEVAEAVDRAEDGNGAATAEDDAGDEAEAEAAPVPPPTPPPIAVLERDGVETLAACIVADAKRRGLKAIFGIPGSGAPMDIMEECRRQGLAFVTCAHESSAAVAAGHHGRALGTPGLCVAIKGVGAGNLVGGAVNALTERLPVVCLCETRASANPAALPLCQHVGDGVTHSHAALFGPSVKYSAVLLGDAATRGQLAAAVCAAGGGRPGAALLDVPCDKGLAPVPPAGGAANGGIPAPLTSPQRRASKAGLSSGDVLFKHHPGLGSPAVDDSGGGGDGTATNVFAAIASAAQLAETEGHHAVQAAARFFSACARTVLVVGADVVRAVDRSRRSRRAPATALVRSLAEAANCAVLVAMDARGAYPESDARFAGVFVSRGPGRYVVENELFEAADGVCFVGMDALMFEGPFEKIQRRYGLRVCEFLADPTHAGAVHVRSKGTGAGANSTRGGFAFGAGDVRVDGDLAANVGKVLALVQQDQHEMEAATAAAAVAHAAPNAAKAKRKWSALFSQARRQSSNASPPRGAVAPVAVAVPFDAAAGGWGIEVVHEPGRALRVEGLSGPARDVLRLGDVVVEVAGADVRRDFEGFAAAMTALREGGNPAALVVDRRGTGGAASNGGGGRAASALASLASLPGFQRGFSESDVSAIRARVLDRCFARPAVPASAASTLTAHDVITTTRALLDRDTGRLFGETGIFVIMLEALFPVDRPNLFFGTTGGRSMGLTLPALIGQRLALPNTPMVGIGGDGSTLMRLGELETMARACKGHPLPFVVLNDGALGTMKSRQRARGLPEFTLGLDGVDYAAIARACGCGGVTATTPDAFRAALKDALAADGPVVIDAKVDPRVYHDSFSATIGAVE